MFESVRTFSRAIACISRFTPVYCTHVWLVRRSNRGDSLWLPGGYGTTHNDDTLVATTGVANTFCVYYNNTIITELNIYTRPSSLTMMIAINALSSSLWQTLVVCGSASMAKTSIQHNDGGTKWRKNRRNMHYSYLRKSANRRQPTNLENINIYTDRSLSRTRAFEYAKYLFYVFDVLATSWKLFRECAIESNVNGVFFECEFTVKYVRLLHKNAVNARFIKKTFETRWKRLPGFLIDVHNILKLSIPPRVPGPVIFESLKDSWTNLQVYVSKLYLLRH